MIVECTDDPEYATECAKMAQIGRWCKEHELVTKEKCAKSCHWCCKFNYIVLSEGLLTPSVNRMHIFTRYDLSADFFFCSVV